MEKVWSSLKKNLQQTTSSIAFIPTIFAISGLLLAFFTITIEYDQRVIDLKEKIEFLLITNKEDGRVLLGTLVASIISLMVFSFSMVMVVLNGASSNFSPRVLPALIGNKPHQVILGFYLCTIIYSLIMLVNFQSDLTNVLPSLGILISMIFGVTSLCLFIFFIHSISKSIQVESILENIFDKTMLQLEGYGLKERQLENKIPDFDGWDNLCVEQAGYLKQLKTDKLIELTEKHNFQIVLRKHIGSFLVKDYPFLQVSNTDQLSSEIIEELKSCFTFYPDDQINDHYLFGFKQISEIGVKALSTGLNDPGTAIKSLNLLTVLFIRRMEINEPLYETTSSGKVSIIYTPVSLKELIFQNLIPIRTFGKGDVMVMLKMLEVIKNMIYADDEKKKYRLVLVTALRSCIEAADAAIKNHLDREQINEVISLIDNKLNGIYRLERLQM